MNGGLSCSAENVDYNRVMETLVFTAGGSTRMCVDLVIIDDEIGENSETLTLSLNSGPQATVTILNNGRTLSLSSASYCPALYLQILCCCCSTMIRTL